MDSERTSKRLGRIVDADGAERTCKANGPADVRGDAGKATGRSKRPRGDANNASPLEDGLRRLSNGGTATTQMGAA